MKKYCLMMMVFMLAVSCSMNETRSGTVSLDIQSPTAVCQVILSTETDGAEISPSERITMKQSGTATRTWTVSWPSWPDTYALVTIDVTDGDRHYEKEFQVQDGSHESFLYKDVIGLDQ
jgi:hypothetical protein